MKRISFLLVLLAASWSTLAQPVSTNPAATDRVLLIDRSSMGVTAGKATLTIGPLARTNGIYKGEYKFSVFPWVQNNEKGKLTIFVSDKSLAEASQGKVVTNSGTATTADHGGACRSVVAIATPIDKDHGTLKLFFTAGTHEMIFAPAYHFAGSATSLPDPPSPEIKH